MMIKKKDIISILVQYGLSVVESDRALDSRKNFKIVMEDICDKAVNQEWRPKRTWVLASDFLKKVAELNLIRSHLRKVKNMSGRKDVKIRLMKVHLKQIRDKIDYLLKHNHSKNFYGMRSRRDKVR